MKKILYLYLMIAFFNSNNICIAKSNINDTLLNNLSNSKNYKDSINIYLKASKYLNYNNIDKSIEYCNIAINIANKNSYYQGIGLAYSYIGAALSRSDTGKNKAILYLYNAINILDKYKSSEIAYTYNSIGNIFLHQGEPVKALENYLIGVDYALKFNELALASLYNNIANVYKKYNKWNEAKNYALMASKIAKKFNNKRYIIFSFIHLGDIYVINDSLNKAKDCYNEVLKIYNNCPTDVSICGALSGIAHVYEKENKMDEALKYYEESLNVAIQFDYSFMVANVYEFLSNFYYNNRNYYKSIECAKKMLEKSLEIKSVDFETKASLVLANSYEKINNIGEAFKYIKIFIKNDSLHQIKLNDLNASIFDYEIKKREKEILLEKQQKQIEILKGKEKNRHWLLVFLISLSIFFIISIIAFIIFYQQRLKLKNIKIEQLKNRYSQEKLSKELDFKRKEMENLALLIIEKNNFTQQLKEMLISLKKRQQDNQVVNEINQILLFASHNLNLTNERKELNIYINSLYQDFYFKLAGKCPELNEYYKRFAVFLRLNFESKEIASILNISTKSVAMSKYRIRKKLNLAESQDLHEYFSKI